MIEKIDIGGPAMVRAAAKNFESVGVVVDPPGTPRSSRSSAATADSRETTRQRLAAAAFAHTAAYDAAVAGWFAEQAAESGMPGFVGLALEKVADLRYGENPHQRGALYREACSRDPDADRSGALASSRARTCRSTTGSMRTRPIRWSRPSRRAPA